VHRNINVPTRQQTIAPIASSLHPGDSHNRPFLLLVAVSLGQGAPSSIRDRPGDSCPPHPTKPFSVGSVDDAGNRIHLAPPPNSHHHASTPPGHRDGIRARTLEKRLRWTAVSHAEGATGITSAGKPRNSSTPRTVVPEAGWTIREIPAAHACRGWVQPDAVWKTITSAFVPILHPRPYYQSQLSTPFRR